MVDRDRTDGQPVPGDTLGPWVVLERLDAGSFGTMGVGLGFAIAAAACNPGKRVIDLEGDSAFGFVTASEPYLEDGIPHIKMLRP